MNDLLNSLGEAWWFWVTAMAWQVALLALVVWSIDLLLRRRGWPQVRYALWALVLIKIFIPPTFALPSSLVSRMRPAQEQEVALIEPEAVEPEPVDPVESVDVGGYDPEPFERDAAISDDDPFREIEPAVALVEAAPPTADPAEVPPDESPSHKVWVMLGIGAMSLLLLTWFISRALRLCRLILADATNDLPYGIEDVLSGCAERLGLRRLPRIIVTDGVRSAAVFGLWRPVLLLPGGACDKLSPQQMEHIMLHELTHVKRGDLLMNTAQALVQIAFWFHPAVWLAGRSLRHLRELCCDAAVSRLLRERTSEYRETLADAARTMLFKRESAGLGLLGLFESPSRLRQRLEHLEKPSWKHWRLKLVVSLAAAALAVICVVPMGQVTAQAAPPEEPAVVEAEAEPDAGVGEELAQRIAGLIDALGAEPDSARRMAAASLGAIGPAAVPALLEALQGENKKVRPMAVLALGKIGTNSEAVLPVLIKVLSDADKEVRAAAVDAVMEIGPEAGAAVPAVVSAVTDEASRGWVIYDMLDKIGPAPKDAVPALVDALKSRNKNVCECAAEALGQMGRAAKDAVPALKELLAGPDARIAGVVAPAALFRITADAEVLTTLCQALKHDDLDVRMGAIKAIGEIGPAAGAAVPHLMEALRSVLEALRNDAAVNGAVAREPHPRSSERFRITHALGDIGADAVSALIAVMGDETREVRMVAAFALSFMRPVPPEVVPALVRRLKIAPAEDRESLTFALGQMELLAKDAVPAIIGVLKDEDPRVRRAALKALGRIGVATEAAVPIIRELLEDEDVYIAKIGAPTALFQMTGDAGVLVPVIDLLVDDDDDLRFGARYALLAGKETTVPPLIAALKNHADKNVRRNIPGILERAGAVIVDRKVLGIRKGVVPALFEALKDDDAGVRHAVPYALNILGWVYPDVIPVYIEKLKDEDADTRCGAIAVLGILADSGKIGRRAQEIVPSVIGMLKDPAPRVRSASVRAVGELVLMPKAMRLIVEALEDKSADVRLEAATVLAEMGKSAKDAAPALRGLLSDADVRIARVAVPIALYRVAEDASALGVIPRALADKQPGVRKYAARRLYRIGPAAKDCVPGLIAALRDTDPETREYAAQAVRGMGPAAKAAVPALAAALKDKHRAVRVSAVRALWPLSPPAEQAAPALVEAFGDRSQEVPEIAISILRDMGVAAVPALIEGLKHEDASVRKRVAWTLYGMGPAAKAAVPALRAAAEDADKDVRDAAAKALKKIEAPAEKPMPEPADIP
jgi:HEAT repeat protein